ncbi:phosphotransferase enzyme family protein [Metabacillus herbersteinensis]|uniref:Phosphotransferase enzyme family protein n=1 Tax=Metabacillus herbersteinensis TaxID=283816 RepID=A0ABV6GAN3_9BACI
MEKVVNDLFTENILHELAESFDVFSREFTLLGDAENYVYEVTKQASSFILRVTHSSHRDEAQISDELSWVDFLQRNGVSAPEVFRSVNDQFIEKVKAKDNSTFYACLFEKVAGKRVNIGEEVHNDKLFYSWGQTIGKMHRLTKVFSEQVDLFNRPSWKEEDLFHLGKYQNHPKKEVIQQFDHLVNLLNHLPQKKENFGLIHSDLHLGNFHYDESEEKLHVFDFDDAVFHWFASDLAIPLYYSVWVLERGNIAVNLEEFATRFLTHFLKGYETENQLSKEDYLAIPIFLKLRDYVLYGFFHKKLDIETITETQKDLIASIEERVINNRAIVTVNYQDILKSI